MEAEISKKVISTSYPSSEFNVEVLSEGDAIVPDSKPDISEILLTDGRCSADKIELQKGRVIFTGTAQFTVLYRPEGGEGVKSLAAKFPFNHIQEANGVMPEDKPQLKISLVHTECSLINSRKLSLKGVISISFISYSDLPVPLCSDISAPNVEVKRETICSSSLGAYASESFTVSDILEVPESKHAIGELLLCRAKISDSSIKLVTGKAVVKGNVSVFHLYTAEDGEIEYMEHSIPFTQIADVQGLTDDMDSDISLSIGDFSSFGDSGSEKEQRQVSFTCNITLSLIAFGNVSENAVTDAYVPGLKSELLVSECKNSEIIERKVDSVTVKEGAELPIDMPPMDKVCPVYAYISSESAVCRDGKITVSGTLSAVISYISGNEIFSFTKDMDFSSVSDCPMGEFFVYSDVKVSHCDYNFINQAKIDLRCILDVEVTLRKNTDSFSSVTALSVGEPLAEERPSVIIYFVKSGDTLWNIAKRYKTTVDKILFANDMTGEEILNSGMRLLIPA